MKIFVKNKIIIRNKDKKGKIKERHKYIDWARLLNGCFGTRRRFNVHEIRILFFNILIDRDQYVCICNIQFNQNS